MRTLWTWWRLRKRSIKKLSAKKERNRGYKKITTPQNQVPKETNDTITHEEILPETAIGTP